MMSSSSSLSSSDDRPVQAVEVIKRPGQGLGLYIREGNGKDRPDGVFISRLAPGSVAEQNGLLRVGDEIISINSAPVLGRRLEDVVISMSIPKRLILTLRKRPLSTATPAGSQTTSSSSLSGLTTTTSGIASCEDEKDTDTSPTPPPVVVLKSGALTPGDGEVGDECSHSLRKRCGSVDMRSSNYGDYACIDRGEGMSRNISERFNSEEREIQRQTNQRPQTLKRISAGAEYTCAQYEPSERSPRASGRPFQLDGCTARNPSRSASADLRFLDDIGYRKEQFHNYFKDLRANKDQRAQDLSNNNLKLLRSYLDNQMCYPYLSERCEAEPVYSLDNTDNTDSYERFLGYDTLRTVSSRSCSNPGKINSNTPAKRNHRLTYPNSATPPLYRARLTTPTREFNTPIRDTNSNSTLSVRDWGSSLINEEKFPDIAALRMEERDYCSSAVYSQIKPKSTNTLNKFHSQLSQMRNRSWSRETLEKRSESLDPRHRDVRDESSRTRSMERCGSTWRQDRTSLLSRHQMGTELIQWLNENMELEDQFSRHTDKKGNSSTLDNVNPARTTTLASKPSVNPLSTTMSHRLHESRDRLSYQDLDNLLYSSTLGRLTHGYNTISSSRGRKMTSQSSRSEFTENNDKERILTSLNSQKSVNFINNNLNGLDTDVISLNERFKDLEINDNLLNIRSLSRIQRDKDINSNISHSSFKTTVTETSLQVTKKPLQIRKEAFRLYKKVLVGDTDSRVAGVEGVVGCEPTAKTESRSISGGLRIHLYCAQELDLKRLRYTNNKSENMTAAHFRELDSNDNTPSRNNVQQNLMNLDNLSRTVCRQSLPDCGHIKRQRDDSQISTSELHKTYRNSNSSISNEIYCVIKVNNSSNLTDTSETEHGRGSVLARSSSLTPSFSDSLDWDESFDLILHDATTLTFSLLSSDDSGESLCAGFGALHLSDVFPSQNIRHDHHRLSLNLEPCGLVYVELSFKPLSQVFERKAAVRGNSLFGTRLESQVLTKDSPESKGVPVVLKRCVQELETRGLDQHDLYRVRGPVSHVEKLKKRLEKSTSACCDDLRDEPHNSITAVIQDYFTSLPEPLTTWNLTPQLLDTVRGLATTTTSSSSSSTTTTTNKSSTSATNRQGTKTPSSATTIASKPATKTTEESGSVNVELVSDPRHTIEQLCEILKRLPHLNKVTLIYFFNHVTDILAHNDDVTTHELSTSLGPALFYGWRPERDRQRERAELGLEPSVALCEYLLNNWNTILKQIT